MIYLRSLKQKRYTIRKALLVILISLALYSLYFHDLRDDFIRNPNSNEAELSNRLSSNEDMINTTDLKSNKKDDTSGKSSIFSNIDPNIFDSKDRKEQCAYLIERILNHDNASGSKQLELNKTLEYLRIYNYCFNNNMGTDLNVLETFRDVSRLLQNGEDIPTLARRFNVLLFPYLNWTDDFQLLWPTVTSVKKQLNIDKPNLDDIPNFNNNFWHNLKENSNGKGIILTMAPDNVDMFQRLINVLDYIENHLPIQIVTTGTEFSQEMLATLNECIMNSQQIVSIVDVHPILNKNYSKTHISGFLNKWIAVLFNTFDEAILIDVDTVPFIDMNEFFNIKSYQKAGIYMYRDREMLHEKADARCFNSFSSLGPTIMEHASIQTKLKFTLQKEPSNFIRNAQMENNVFDNFFHRGNMHQVDSGLVVIDRQKQLGSLLISFALHLSGEFDDCVHGDKEFFWLGPLLAGRDYSIDPVQAGLAGSLYAETDKEGICSTQIAHANNQDKLMWVNGGLHMCKFKDAATVDFGHFNDFFTERYHDIDNLQAIYNAPLSIDSIIIPDSQREPWMQTRECKQFRFCGYVKDAGKEKIGHLIKLSGELKTKYNRISQLWNAKVK